MEFKIRETVLVKDLVDYVFMYDKVHKKRILLNNRFSFLLEQNHVFDSNELGCISSDEKTRLESLIKRYDDFFAVIGIENEVGEDFLPENPSKKTGDYDGTLAKIFVKQPRPWNIVLETTTVCNLRCKHCYNKNDNTRIKVQNVEKLFSMIDPNDNFIVTLTGGEVFTNPEFFDILDVCKRYNKVVNILSNATLIDIKTINRLKKYDVNYIRASLYSVDENIHDKMTKIKGSCAKTKNAIKNLQENGFKVRIASLITPDNYFCVSSLAEYAKNISAPISFCFKCIGNCDDPCLNSNCDLDNHQFKEAYREYLKVNNISGLNKKSFYEDHVCLAGINKFVMGAQGTLFLCPVWKNYVIEKIENINKFEEFWLSEKMMDIRSLNRQDFHECIKCEINDYCRTCMAANFNKTANILLLDETRCRIETLKYKIESEA